MLSRVSQNIDSQRRKTYTGSALTEGTERAKLLQALLQNTLEQNCARRPGVLGCRPFVSRKISSASSAAAALFVVGRLLFFRGYASRPPPSRAAGFGLTFYPSVALLISVVAGAVLQGDT
jgi:hypothetical protein